MTHLLSDPHVVEAAGKGLQEFFGGRWPEFPGAGDDPARAVLTAAVAALPRDELVEKAARAMAETDSTPRGEIEWGAFDIAEQAQYRDYACAALVAIGLIPERTPEEEARP